MSIKIENATTQILDSLYETEKKCFEKEAFSKHQISCLLQDCNSISLVARINGEISGFIIGRIDLINDKPIGHIMTIDVLPKFQRKGIAQLLMLEIENLLKQKGTSECHIEVRQNNTAALKLYQKLGYKQIEVLENYYGKTHGIYLRKKPL